MQIRKSVGGGGLNSDFGLPMLLHPVSAGVCSPILYSMNKISFQLNIIDIGLENVLNRIEMESISKCHVTALVWSSCSGLRRKAQTTVTE